LPVEGELVIGRGPELDLVLVEDMVSREHARVTVSSARVLVQDLGSTNGTFVNGDKVTQADLSEGDRILIGTSVAKLIRRGGRPMAAADAVPEGGLGEAEASVGPVLAGSLADVSLPEVLQLFAAGKKDGDLLVRSVTGRVATVAIRKGGILGVRLGGCAAADSYKGLYRALTWDEGTFEMLHPEADEFEAPLPESVEALLMEGTRQRDELGKLSREMPGADVPLVLCSPLVPRLQALTPELLDTLQLVHNYGALAAVLDRSAATDLDTAKEILYLLRNAYLSEA